MCKMLSRALYDNVKETFISSGVPDLLQEAVPVPHESYDLYPRVLDIKQWRETYHHNRVEANPWRHGTQHSRFW